MLFKNLRERLRIEGIMPERALLRLKRGGISLYNVKKIEKNALVLSVKRKDIEKVFAIYPNVCYNNSAYHPYKVIRLGGEGFAKGIDFLKNRAGILLGVLAFAILTLGADGLVFGVELVGAQAYRREVLQALEENGVARFGFYPEGVEDLVCARLLRIDGAEFCSVKKVGHWVRVEIRTNPFSTDRLKKESMTANRTGIILSLTALRGTPLKKAGEEVAYGEPLVGNFFQTQDGEQVCVEPIARVTFSCVFEQLIAAESEEEAFAEGYLSIGLAEGDKIVEKSVASVEGGFLVNIRYHATQAYNL